MKRFLLLLLINLFWISAFAEESAFYYEYSDKDSLYEPSVQLSAIGLTTTFYRDIEQRIMSEFDIKINSTTLDFSDSSGHAKHICKVSIDTQGKQLWQFDTSGHRSLLLESIFVNYLQPNISSWPLTAILLEVNGVFSDELKSDRIYDSLMTRKTIIESQLYKRR